MPLMNENFLSDGNVFLVRCPNKECGLENWAPIVAEGVCAWCGYDGNADAGFKSTLKEFKGPKDAG